MPETISSLEIIRLIVALAGIRAAWIGRHVAQQSRSEIAPEGVDDIYKRASVEQRDARMRLFEMVQTGFFFVHMLLAINVLVNFGYPSASVEQPNVISSNVAQIMIPVILTRLSEMIVLEMRTVTRLRTVAGERPQAPSEHAP